MNEPNLLETVAQIVREVSPASAELTIGADSLLVDELGLDSLDLVSLLMRIQDDFAVEFDLDRVGDLRKVGDVLTMLHAQLSRKAAA